MKCGVTGSSGYLGSRVVQAMKQSGWHVIELSRESQVAFDLKTGLPPDFFSDTGIDVLIHCAYDFSKTLWKDIHAYNVEGSVRLLQQAHTEGVRKIVFISSMSAFEGCVSKYGLAKLEVEKVALALGGLVIRPGLIYGDGSTGMLNALSKVVRKSPIVPLIGNGKHTQYFCHEEDLTSVIVRYCKDEIPLVNHPVLAASPNGRTFKEILKCLAKSKGKSCWFVPIPWPIIWISLRVAELLSLSPPFRSDSVISLVNQDPHPDFESTKALGLFFREYDSKSS